MGAAMANETLGSLKNLPTNMKHTPISYTSFVLSQQNTVFVGESLKWASAELFHHRSFKKIIYPIKSELSSEKSLKLEFFCSFSGWRFNL
jgi:hypothetical protein